MKELMKSRKQMADEIGVSPRTLNRWLKNLNFKLSSGLICPKNQKLIKDLLGVSTLVQ
jgi:transcriptional regulator with XRE-family HTH domain